MTGQRDDDRPDTSIESQIDRLADEFEVRWHSSRLRPSIRDFLERVAPDQREVLFVELVTMERQLCGADGKPFDFAQHEREYPEFRKQIQSLQAKLDPTLAPEIQPDKGTESSSQRSRSKRIGPYKLLQQIGKGGMGEVWMAEQESPIRRRVALKLIRMGLDSDQVVARFEAERQALALMSHPNIARVLDGGETPAGLPFFVMEMVPGIPITEYCDKHALSISERLQLFIPVCRAIQHAHQKGIIHRDLKPSNILISLHDGIPVPKVIDFGLAKALQHQSRLTDKTFFTEFGQVVGTLQYMSPEQAEMNALDVDTRTDIYSLGVLLYELLTGSTPLDRDTLNGGELLHTLKLIREKDPPRPSDRLSSSSQEVISGVGAQRKIAPSQLSQVLRGELDWIVMKSLEKDRSRRYESSGNLAEDLQRFLDDEPILARPPSVGYRLGKLVKKHRLAIGSAAVILFLLIAGLVSTGVMWGIARNEAHRARSTERELTKALEQTVAAERLASEKAQEALKSLCTALTFAPPDRVPGSIRSLQPQQAEAKRLLQAEFDQLDDVGRLHTAFALAAFGVDQSEFLTDQIPYVPMEESRNLLRALKQLTPHSLPKVIGKFGLVDRYENPDLHARYAMIALELGNPEPLQAVLSRNDDPSGRSIFADEFADWSLSVETVLELITDASQPDLQYSLCLAIGELDPYLVLADPQLELVRKRLSSLALGSPDPGVRAAAQWALTKCDVTINATDEEAPKNSRWFVNTIGQTMIAIPPGQFYRYDAGSASTVKGPLIVKKAFKDSEGQVVQITHPFAIADSEVTLEQFARFLNARRQSKDAAIRTNMERQVVGQASNLAQAATQNSVGALAEPQAMNLPTWNVTWPQAASFCNWLSDQEGFSKVYHEDRDGQWTANEAERGYRLPTEAEWEYAARAGAITPHSFGGTRNLLDQLCRLSFGIPGTRSFSMAESVGDL